MTNTPVLDIHIEANGAPIHFKGETAEIDIIPFKGTADCDLFHGIVEPCGVDTQIVNAVHVRHMSARYVLSGKDREGNDCHIFVENNGWFDDMNKSMPFHTIPTFYTDSPVLAPLLHSSRFTGEGIELEDGLHIRFYEIREGEK